jgi:hypothetical protein
MLHDMQTVKVPTICNIVHTLVCRIQNHFFLALFSIAVHINDEVYAETNIHRAVFLALAL